MVSLSEIDALRAEDHYLRVYTRSDEELILYRFSDAISEMSDNDLGLQVHRSYWVNRSEIDFIESHSQKLTVILKSGLNAPVSARYYELVRQLAESSGIPIKYID